MYIATIPTGKELGVYGPFVRRNQSEDAARRLNDWFKLRDCPQTVAMHFAEQGELFEHDRDNLRQMRDAAAADADGDPGAAHQARAELRELGGDGGGEIERRRVREILPHADHAWKSCHGMSRTTRRALRYLRGG